MNHDDVIDYDDDDDTAPRPAQAVASAFEQMPDGVYLHLDEDIYHAQHRLSASGVGKLMQSEADFWAASWMNPKHDDTPTEAMRLGRAFHSAKLEPHLLDEKFIRDLHKSDLPASALLTDTEVRAAIKELQPKPEDHPGVLMKDGDVKAALKALDLPQSKAGETAEDRQLRLHEADPSVRFWADVVYDWEQENGPIKEPEGETPEGRARRLQALGFNDRIWCLEREAFELTVEGRTKIGAEFWDQMQEDVAEMSSDPTLKSHLTGGRAEVSVLWTDTETGVKWKARIDYLRPDMHTDVKTYANPSRKPVTDCLRDAFRYNGYYRQGHIYDNAVERIRAGAVELMDSDKPEDIAFLQSLRDHPRHLECWYIFQQKGGIPNVFAMKAVYYLPAKGLREGATGLDADKAQAVFDAYEGPTMLMMKARRDVEACVDKFIGCMTEYGTSEKWKPLNPVGQFDDFSFPSFWIDPTMEAGDVVL